MVPNLRWGMLTSDGPDEMWVFARSMRQVSSDWWDLILDGVLWQVSLKDFPFQIQPNTFRMACYRYAERRGVRVSVRFDSTGAHAYVQAMGKSQSSVASRKPMEEAYIAPPVPRVATARVIAGDGPVRPNFSDMAAELVAATDGEPMTPERLRRHPAFGWLADSCDCKTENFRYHPFTCKAHTYLPLIRVKVRSLEMTPERFIRELEAGNRPIMRHK